MEDLRKEVEKLKYHQKILLNIIGSEEPNSALFFHQIIGYDLNEFQVNSLLKLLTTIEKSLKENCSFSEEDIEKFESIGLYINDDFLHDDNIVKELKQCMITLKIDIELKYLLLSLKKQHILENLCDQLLHKISENL